MKTTITILILCLITLIDVQIGFAQSERNKNLNNDEIIEKITSDENMKAYINAMAEVDYENNYIAKNEASVTNLIAKDLQGGFYAIYKLKDQSRSKYAWASSDFHIVIPLDYEGVKSIGRGRAMFRYKGKWGVLRVSDLKVLHEAKYDAIARHTLPAEGLYVEENGKEFYIREDGEKMPYLLLGNPNDNLRRVIRNGKYGYINAKGEAIIPPSLTYALSFSDGLAYTSNGNEKGYIDPTGKMVIKTSHSGFFSEGLLAIEENDKYGFMNKSGKNVIPCQYEEVSNFQDGLAAVKKNGQWGFVDKTNKIVISPKYDDVDGFSEGLAAVTQSDKMGFINKKGSVVIPLEYESYYGYNFENGEVWLKKESEGVDHWGKINSTGKIIIPFKYPVPLSTLKNPKSNKTEIVQDVLDDYYIVTKNPIEFTRLYCDGITQFTNGLAYIFWSSTRRFGIINTEGKEILPMEYDGIGDLSNELIWVNLGDSYGLINRQGKEILPCNYFYISPFVFEGKALVIDEDWNRYFIDKQGNKVKK